jgi:hypothetical protein
MVILFSATEFSIARILLFSSGSSCLSICKCPSKSCTRLSPSITPSLHPLLKRIPLNPIRHSKPVSAEHNLLIQIASRRPRLPMPRSQTPSIRVFPAMPETYAHVSDETHKPATNNSAAKRPMNETRRQQYLQVARLRRSPSFFPNQYFNNPPLSHASR